jgi:hypothetical protein
MNSLPLISHHLFVAAIGNEGRDHARSRCPVRASLVPEDHLTDLALKDVEETKALDRGGIGRSWAPAVQPEA